MSRNKIATTTKRMAIATRVRHPIMAVFAMPEPLLCCGMGGGCCLEVVVSDCGI
jgi:hypothetical protein